MSSASQQDIQVLHVDDDPSITDLTGTFLERESDQFTVETATSADEGLEIIDDNSPDCVVSDYNMPGMDGLEFLQAVRDEYPDLPFILFTGKGSEAVASDAISAGVTDYLQKESGTSHYTVLANRISNAVEATRSAAKAEQRRHRLEQILKTAPGCVVQCDGDGEFVLANERAEAVLGLETDELTQRAYNDPEWELETPNGEPIPDEKLPFRQVRDTGEPVYDATHAITWPDGSRKVLSVNAAPLLDETGAVESVVASLNDITDRRERQRELRLLEQAIEDAADGVAIIDDEEEYVYVDRSHVDMYGFEDKKQLLGDTWRKLYDDGEVERLEREAFPALEADGHWRGMVTGSRPDGSTFPAELSLTVVEDERVICTVRDETERRQREQRFQALVEESNDIISIVDSEGRYQYQSPSLERILGYVPEDTVGDKAWEYIHPDDRERIIEEFNTWVDHPDRMSESVEYRVRHADGSWRWMETEGNEQFDNPAVEGYVINSRDITDRRERQRELRLLQQAIDDANVPITLADPSQPDDPLVYINDAFEEMTGYSPTETLGRNCRFLQGEDTDPEQTAALREAIENERQVTAELSNYRKDGTEFWNRLTVTPIYDDDGNLVRYLGTQEDITERKQREQELESERRFVQQTLDVIDDIFYVVDTDGRLRRWNAKGAEITGYKESELDGMPVIELFPKDERETVNKSIETALTDGEDMVKTDLLTADGQRVPHEFTGARLADEDGNTAGLVGVGRDLTERKRRERRFQALVEESNDVISVVGPDGVFQYQSPSVKRILGYEPEETVGDTAWEYVHPDDRADLIEAFEQGVADPDANPVFEYRARHADGFWRWLEANGNNQLDNPAVEGYVVNSRDITERKEREQELQELKNQYETLVENFPDGAVFLIDGELEYVRAGGDELSNVGLSPDDVEGTNPHALFPEDIADELCHYYEKALDGTANTFKQQYGGGRYRIQTVPIRTAGEEIRHVMAVSQNITEQVEDRQELAKQNERLSEFVSIVSHDLRNPLRVADGRLELIRQECESDHIDDLAKALDRMDALIEDLLTLAREGEQVGETEPVELANAAENSWQTVNTVQAVLEIETSQSVEADRTRLQQLFENLYRNAVEHGGDDVTVSVGAMDDGFYVADTGPGIPESDREEIFEAGYSTDDEGTGFGLRIVEQIAHAHGWEITATESEQGGARFEITGVEFTDR